MATVTGLTAFRTLEIDAATITSATVNESGHIILTRKDGTQIDGGDVNTGIPEAPTATTEEAGQVELATPDETVEGLDDSRAVTPAGLAAMAARNDVGIYVPAGWGQFWKPKRDNSDSALATVAAVGSSSTQGLYSSNLLTASFVSRIMTSLQETYGDGGSGYFSSARSSTFFGDETNPNAWASLPGNFASVTGTWGIGNTYGPGANYLSTSVNGATISFTVRGTTIRVYTMSGGGRVGWTYSIDGGSAVAVADSGSVSIQVTTITGLSDDDHTIVLTHNGTGGSYFSPCGVTGENDTGVVVNNYGLSGAKSSDFSDASEVYLPGTWNGGPNYPADLLIYALGANDAYADVTPDVYISNLRQFLDHVKDGTSTSGAKSTGETDILILMQHIGTYDSSTLRWQDYTARARMIAEAYGAAFVDMWPIGRNSWNYWNDQGNWGNPSTAGGVSGTDTIHMSDAGHEATANAILPLLVN